MAWLGLGNLKPKAQASSSHCAGLASGLKPEPGQHYLRTTLLPPPITATFSAAADGAEGIRASQIVSIFVLRTGPPPHLELFGACWALPATKPPAFPLSDGVVLVASRYWLDWDLNRSGRCILHKKGDVRCSLSRVWSVFGFCTWLIATQMRSKTGLATHHRPTDLKSGHKIAENGCFTDSHFQLLAVPKVRTKNFLVGMFFEEFPASQSVFH